MSKQRALLALLLLCMGFLALHFGKRINLNTSRTVGEKIDSLNGVFVYYNGGVDHVGGRNLTPDNYNLGLQYQCVEFVKRYYFQHLNHRMPNTYGHAKDFFDPTIKDGQKNEARDLLQFSNPSHSKPLPNDIVVFSGTILNRFGHVAIVSSTTDNTVEIIQQNPGPFQPSRKTFPLLKIGNTWKIDNNNIVGWLRNCF